MRIPTIRLILLLITLGRLLLASVAADDLAGGVDLGSGTNVTLRASAESNIPVSFQWQKNGVDLPGATSAALSLTNVSAADAGMYTAIASNSAGSMSSNALLIRIVDAIVGALAPVITEQPQDLLSLLSGGGSFRVSATGSPAPSYQWLKNGVPITGQTASVLTLSSLSLGEAYSVVVSNSAGTVVSRTAQLLSLGDSTQSSGSTGVAPVITREPGDLSAHYGSNVSFLVSATGAPMPTYAWYKDGVPIPGATNGFLSVTNVQSDATYSAMVSNSAGSVWSRTARLNVLGQPAQTVQTTQPAQQTAQTAPSFTLQPTSTSAVGGAAVNFTAAASGSPAPSYQWMKDGTPLAGATNATLSFSSITSQDAGGYRVTATNSAGSATSDEAWLNVAAMPLFTQHPVSQAVMQGSSVTFTVTAIGAPAPSLQWRKNGSPIDGATTSSLRLDSVTKDHEGTYDAIAANWVGNVASNGASLLVQAAPAPAEQPPSSTASATPIAGVVLRANYVLNIEPGTQRTVGFFIRADSSRTLLVRAVGPTLGTLGISGGMADPAFELYNGSNLVGGNDNWGGSEDLMRAFAQAGAAPMMSTNSRDAALLTSVAPGAYSVVVSSADGGGGTVLVEVYEFPAGY